MVTFCNYNALIFVSNIDYLQLINVNYRLLLKKFLPYRNKFRWVDRSSDKRSYLKAKEDIVWQCTSIKEVTRQVKLPVVWVRDLNGGKNRSRCKSAYTVLVVDLLQPRC